MNFLIDFAGWCSGEHSIQNVLHLIKTILDIVRIVVPIALIAMTSLDIAKKVINPDDKDGQKKIMIRAIAALLVFLTPTIISITFKVVDLGTGVDMNNVDSSLSGCWNRA